MKNLRSNRPTIVHPGMANQLARRFRLLIHFLCICALVLTAFAHRAPAFAETQLVQTAAYVLPDGSRPTLCVTVADEVGGSHPVSHQYQSCEFCRIAGSVALPLPSGIAEPAQQPDGSESRTMPVTAILVADGFRPGAPPHGPPAV